MIRKILRPSTPRSVFAAHVLAAFLSAVLVLGVVYNGVMRLLEAQTAAVVEADLRGLIDEYRDGGQFALRAAIARRTNDPNIQDAVYLFATNEDHPLAGNLSRFPDIPLDGSWHLLELVRTDKDRDVTVGGRAFLLSTGAKVFVGRDLREQREFRVILLWASLAMLVFFLLTGGVAGYLVSKSILRRLKGIETAAADIAAGNLSRRAPETQNDDEFDRLSRSLNTMLDRNEALVTELRTVTDSLAHDLRTPLARLHNRLEDIAEGKEGHAEDALRELEHIQTVLAALMDISRLESGIAAGQFEALDLVEIAQTALELYEPLADERQQVLSYNGIDQAQMVGHGQFVAMAITNLLDNAIKYSPDGGHIALSVYSEPNEWVLCVTDSGPGISADDWPEAIKRFGRLDKARSTPGSGLGLNLVAMVAKLHGATLVNCPAETGTKIALHLPKA